MSTRCPQLTIPRKEGAVVIEIVSPETPGRSWVELVGRNVDGSTRQSLGIRAEELGQFIDALQQCDRVLNGHPKHRAKESVG